MDGSSAPEVFKSRQDILFQEMGSQSRSPSLQHSLGWLMGKTLEMVVKVLEVKTSKLCI